MKKTALKLLLAVITLMTVTAASAQIHHGIAFDLGKTSKKDSTSVTNFGFGLVHNTDTLKGLQLNGIQNYARSANGMQLSSFSNISGSPIFRWVWKRVPRLPVC